MYKFFLFFLLSFFPKWTFAEEALVNPLPNLDNNMTQLPEPQFQHTFFKMLIVLIAVIALLWLTFWLLRKITSVKIDQANSIKAIKIIERRALSPKTMLYLVEVEKEKVLIAESHLEVKRLHNIASKES